MIPDLAVPSQITWEQELRRWRDHVHSRCNGDNIRCPWCEELNLQGGELVRVYVAGKTHDYKRVQQVRDRLRACGHEVTYDWTETVAEVGPDACTTSELTHTFKRECAEKDLQGVKDADIVIALMSEGITGTLVEIGAALALDIPVWIVGDVPRETVFFELSLVRRITYLSWLLSDAIQPVRRPSSVS